MNTIDAIINLISDPKFLLKSYSSDHNRANDMGTALEEYIKDLFAGTVNENDPLVRMKKLSETFSYLGNQNNPPDSIIRGGDAIEVKKIESNDSALALNSSYPKAKLFCDSTMISNACRKCEKWTEKDMIYTVGVVGNGRPKSLAFVYGDDYCAEQSVYEKIKNTIKSGVESIPNVEFSETKELGRINRVDPLGITYMRVRGMWGIENPFCVFKKYFVRDHKKEFNFMCIVNEKKFSSFQNSHLIAEYAKKDSRLNIDDIEIPDPNNPASLKKAELITFTV